MTTVEQLLLIVDRAERGSMLAEEAVVLRAGIRALAANGDGSPEKAPQCPSKPRSRLAGPPGPPAPRAPVRRTADPIPNDARKDAI